MSIFELIQHAGLGGIIFQPETLSGGALHKMIKLQTSKGVFAVKEINPHIVAKENFKTAYELAESIAEHFKIAHIPAISALRINDQYVTKLGRKAYIIYPYVDGQILSEKEITTAHVSKIGKIYAAMHATRLNIPGVDVSHYDFFNNDDWIQLIKSSNSQELNNLLPNILNWNNHFEISIPILNTELVITHRDMHSKNVLWDANGTPHIIDWESAGLMNPGLEVIGYGLEWSRILLNHAINWSLFEALINSYHEHSTGKIKTDPQVAFWGWLGHCVLGWTAFNIQRMIGNISKEQQEINLGRKIIDNVMLPCLNYIAEHEKSILDKLSIGNKENHQVFKTSLPENKPT
ncbi:aminoglycoside phosphotransferase (plasmid) [Legionella adelaidensis]|uniref:Aminoglycoside phosphotransferase n=1 Tax=Legionella adelaidensis TaxID=45056 RepID=A0A0W0R235_9GAMM|nr:aminoglycoside phosphotransferase family protein [Legionella adelaidensis]KTC65033.1 putative aminoglycoside phosphotransferase [Legionella adelaidensis]VEH85448.1 aminoglycoside phosphotransferase [Legionella adelaidensis]